MQENFNNQTAAFPQWAGFHHIALVTPDLDETIRFYEQVLGMQAGPVFAAAGRRGRHCFIRPGNVETWGIHFFETADARIFQSIDELKRLAEQPSSDAIYGFLPGALQHIAFSLPSEADGLALRSKLEQLGVVTTAIYDQGRIRNFIFTDNNGIQLEAAWPKPGHGPQQRS
ncbi:hypothetical protein PAESOLCIP111_06029 [Paenibacillus solanacearum]|uniref:VOC domain-containing protein n=1 Tax=Paenibacillus solanacearum TaxID=2048548 RepID=A0A916NLH9_9BACL|nr:VOC family protein [Paenibacillus solanacearum]CAG7650210.1 hypothetical protein PAESOLCIP111_06029 [Paenibacillus solanacearum]